MNSFYFDTGNTYFSNPHRGLTDHWEHATTICSWSDLVSLYKWDKTIQPPCLLWGLNEILNGIFLKTSKTTISKEDLISRSDLACACGCPHKRLCTRHSAIIADVGTEGQQCGLTWIKVLFSDYICGSSFCVLKTIKIKLLILKLLRLSKTKTNKKENKAKQKNKKQKTNPPKNPHT